MHTVGRQWSVEVSVSFLTDWSEPTYPDNINSTHLVLDTLYSNNLSQIVSEFTRFHGNDTPSLLDLILTSDENLLTLPDYLPHINWQDTLSNLTPNEQWIRYLDIAREALSECSHNILTCRIRDKP